MLHAHSSFRPISESIRVFVRRCVDPIFQWLTLIIHIVRLYLLMDLFTVFIVYVKLNKYIANCAPRLHLCSRLSYGRMCERIIYFAFNVFLFYGLDAACKFGRRRRLPAASNRCQPSRASSIIFGELFVCVLFYSSRI